MAGVWVEDNSIGQALSGLADSFSGARGAQMANIQSEIWLRNLQREKMRQEMQREQGLENAKNQLPGLAAKVTAAEAVPVPTPDYGNVGATVVPSSGAPPLQLAPDIEKQNVRANEQRAKNILDARTAFTQAGTDVGARAIKSTDDVSKFYSQYGTGLNLNQMAPQGSEEERRRQAIINPTAFGSQKDAINIFAPEHREPLLERTAVGMSSGQSIDPKAAGTLKNLLEDKYQPKTELVETPEGPRQRTIQQQMTPRDAAIYDTVTKMLAPAAAATAPTPPPATAAAQAAPATSGTGAPKDVATTAPVAAIPKTENAPQAPKPFITAQGGVTMAPVPGAAPKPPTETQAKAGIAASMVKPEVVRLAGLMGVDPKTGLSLDPKKEPALPSYFGAGIQRATGDVPLLSGAGGLAERAVGGDPNKLVQYYTSGQTIAENIVRFISGAQINPSEYKSYYYMFIPQPGDSKEVIQQKFERLNVWQEAISNAMSPAQAVALASKALPGDPSVVLTNNIQSKNPQAATAPYQPAGPAASSGADAEALKWAKANPTDPRAAKIMQRLGAQ